MLDLNKEKRPIKKGRVPIGNNMDECHGWSYMAAV